MKILASGDNENQRQWKSKIRENQRFSVSLGNSKNFKKISKLAIKDCKFSSLQKLERILK